MRTTLTINDSIAHRLKEKAAMSRCSFKDTVNEVLLRGLSAEDNLSQKPIKLKTFDRSYQPGIDEVKLSEYLDDSESLRKILQ